MKSCYIDGIAYDEIPYSIDYQAFRENLDAVVLVLLEAGISDFYVSINDGVPYLAVASLAAYFAEQYPSVMMYAVPERFGPDMHNVLFGHNIRRIITPSSWPLDEVFKQVDCILLIGRPEPHNPYQAQVINITPRELALFDTITQNMVMARVSAAANKAYH